MNDEQQIQLQLIVTVERAVRPIRASTTKKRQMREELLAHLTAIHEQEQARTSDPALALAAATRRFGDPAELARELAADLPASERTSNFLEWLFGWRAPESAARYLLRLATVLFLIGAFVVGLAVTVTLVSVGWDGSVWRSLRPAVTLWLFLPFGQFLLGLLYFTMRDAMWGAFGRRKSLAKVMLFDVLIALVVLGVGLGFIALGSWCIAAALEMLPAIGAAAGASAIGYLALAHFRGGREIADTVWACLDLKSPPASGDSSPSDGTTLDSA